SVQTELATRFTCAASTEMHFFMSRTGASRDLSQLDSKPHQCKTSKRSLEKKRRRSIVWMVPAPAPRIEPPARAPLNDAYATPRLNALKRLAKGPSHVKRLGHCVLNVKNFRESEAWYKSRFGLITSDEINLESPERALGAFLRCDRGAVPSDHHTLFLLGTGKPGFNHAAFEVADFDDLMSGHDWLKEKDRRHEWGVGRHLLGSQSSTIGVTLGDTPWSIG